MANSSIAQICASLSNLSSPLSQAEIRSLLDSVAAHAEELRSFERFDDSSYCRNRIFRNEFVDLLLLCWKPSQRTPIHDHAGSICGVYVMRGEAIEIGFAPSGVGLLVPKESRELAAGDVTVSEDSDAHLVANFAAPAQDLVTLHCYSPPLTSMRIFNEKDTFFADYPSITACASGSGCYHIQL
jgi:cysteine dioxygenase